MKRVETLSFNSLGDWSQAIIIDFPEEPEDFEMIFSAVVSPEDAGSLEVSFEYEDEEHHLLYTCREITAEKLDKEPADSWWGKRIFAAVSVVPDLPADFQGVVLSKQF